jgi:hypothetical protein
MSTHLLALQFSDSANSSSVECVIGEESVTSGEDNVTCEGLVGQLRRPGLLAKGRDQLGLGLGYS